MRTRFISAFGANAGSLGPVGVSGLRILADSALRGRKKHDLGREPR